MEILTLVFASLAFLCAFAAWMAALLKKDRSQSLENEIRTLRNDVITAEQTATQQTNTTITNLINGIDNRMANQAKNELEQLETMRKTLDEKITRLRTENTQQLEAMRNTLDEKSTQLRSENNRQLDEIRKTVDEKLQSTLEERISRSFQTVSERLEEVYKGLGEMKTLANGVGDLKKVLSNVKTRGILGEIQLNAILAEILSPDQYETNVATVPGSRNVVEFAIRLPGGDEGAVYLPVDSKFPLETYQALLDARESGEQLQIQAATNALIQRIKGEAKDIRDKYVSPPHTTDFAILFLPIEGLYAEVVQLGMIEELQRTYHVNIAGPTTMAALLNSLQMGFRTLAVQKRSVEVWNVLGAVKTEFAKFEQTLTSTQRKLDQAYRELDTLVGTRTRVINRKLRSVSALSPDESENYLLSAAGENTASGENEEEI